MNYVKNFVFYGNSVKEIPCITGNGGPGGYIEAAVGSLYMDVDSGEIYKCTKFKEGVSTWALVSSEPVDISDKADKTYVDESIQTAILDSWEAAV